MKEIELDGLLRQAAGEKRGEFNKEAVRCGLERAVDNASGRECAARAYPRFRRATLWGGAACAALAAVLALCFMDVVVVNGQTRLAVNRNVTVNGVRQSLAAAHGASAPGSAGGLVRLEHTNQYVSLEDAETGEDAPRIVTLPLEAEPLPAKNAQAVSGQGDEPHSLAPTQVFPVIGDLAVREGPDTAYAALGELYSGQCVTKVGVWGDWAILQWEGGIAYAFNAYLYEVPIEEQSRTAVTLCATEPVNVRALPTSREDSAILYELQTGEAVSCTGIAGEWTQILFHGEQAYVFSRYLGE